MPPSTIRTPLCAPFMAWPTLARPRALLQIDISVLHGGMLDGGREVIGPTPHDFYSQRSKLPHVDWRCAVDSTCSMIDCVLDPAALSETLDLSPSPCPILLVRGRESWAPDPEADGRPRAFRDAHIVTIDGAGQRGAPRSPRGLPAPRAPISRDRLSAMSLVRWAVLLALALGCQSPPPATRSDLQAYLARSKGWAPREAEAARTVERILATEFVDEAEVLRQIADSRPRLLAHLERVRAYTPQSEDVLPIHRRYVGAWQRLLAAYDAIEEGFSSGDYAKLARGREHMAEWKNGILGVAQDIRQLMQHCGIEPETSLGN